MDKRHTTIRAPEKACSTPDEIASRHRIKDHDRRRNAREAEREARRGRDEAHLSAKVIQDRIQSVPDVWEDNAERMKKMYAELEKMHGTDPRVILFEHLVPARVKEVAQNAAESVELCKIIRKQEDEFNMKEAELQQLGEAVKAREGVLFERTLRLRNAVPGPRASSYGFVPRCVEIKISGAFVLNRCVVLQAIDVTLLDGVRTRLTG